MKLLSMHSDIRKRISKLKKHSNNPLNNIYLVYILFIEDVNGFEAVAIAIKSLTMVFQVQHPKHQNFQENAL